ncbi:nuclear transport factor 2 family protein, partial [Streptomyces sp. TRM76130]|nr:nuclear transport factor 2 family protein [Streptomyces sp. TRM76130]
MSGTTDPEARDRSDIIDLVTTYCFALDRRDFDRVASVFTEDAAVQNAFDAYMPEGEKFAGVVTGGRALADGVSRMFSRLDATQHLLGATIVEPTDEGAHASTQVVAHHHRGGEYYHTGGTYEDDLVRTPDGWR